MLARAFAQTAPDVVYIYNRSRVKAESVAADHTNIVICDQWQSLISRVDTVFLCTKVKDGLAFVQENGGLLRNNQLLVTTISSVDLDHWRTITAATPVKLIPSLTQTVARGVILLSYPRQMPQESSIALENRLGQIGQPCVVDEGQVRVCSDIASCGPAFLSTICQGWAQAAAQTGVVDRLTADKLIRDMLVGLAGLLEAGMSFDDVIRRIRVPGGVTERGIESMEDAPQRLFARLHAETTHFSSHGAHSSLPDSLSSSRA